MHDLKLHLVHFVQDAQDLKLHLVQDLKLHIVQDAQDLTSCIVCIVATLYPSHELTRLRDSFNPSSISLVSFATFRSLSTERCKRDLDDRLRFEIEQLTLQMQYGVATISRLLKIIGLLSRTPSLL